MMDLKRDSEENLKNMYILNGETTDHKITLICYVDPQSYIETIKAMRSHQINSTGFIRLCLYDPMHQEMIFQMDLNETEQSMNPARHYKNIPQPDIEMLINDQYEKKYE